MWGSSKQTRSRYQMIIQRGFTLLEMLMVIFIIGLSAALVSPNLPKLFDRLSFALERDTFVRELNTLSYRAFDKNQDFVLAGNLESNQLATENDEMSASQSVDAFDIVTPYRSASVHMMRLAIPDDWTVKVPEPIFYRSSGFCTGGTVTIQTGQLEYSFVLDAPYCQVLGTDK